MEASGRKYSEQARDSPVTPRPGRFEPLHPLAPLGCRLEKPATEPIVRRRLSTVSPVSRRAFRRENAKYLAFLLLRRRIARVHDPGAVVYRLCALFAGLDDLDLRHVCRLLGSAGRFMRQRYECRFKSRLVTCRHIHVAKLSMRRDRAAAGAHRNKRAISALVPRRQVFEPFRRRHPPAFLPVVDVSRRQRASPVNPGHA